MREGARFGPKSRRSADRRRFDDLPILDGVAEKGLNSLYTYTRLPAHGFARTAQWTIVGSESNEREKAVTFALGDSPATRAMWPFAFALLYRVSVSDVLCAALTVTNAGDEPFEFTEALHSYFDVCDIDAVSLEGLAGGAYLDKVEGFARKRQREALLRFSAETDRIYLATGGECAIHDARRARRIRIRKAGSHSTVVWNPWRERARQMGDFPDEGYRDMLCVESANTAQHPVCLAPGQRHTLSVFIDSVTDS